MAEKKAELVSEALAAKKASGKTFDEIAAECGLTNIYTANLFFLQAQLKPDRVEKLRRAVPKLPDEVVEVMLQPPFRSFDPTISQEPLIYRLYEACMHNAEAIKAVINEKFGDGIMSAIDFYCSVDKIRGVKNEERVAITFNGKFLPHVEQLAEHNTAKLAVPTL